MKHIIILSILLVSSLITGCSHQSPMVAEVQPTPVKPKPVICGSIPPIKDKTKLKASLLERGLISEKMSTEEADAIVNDYIRKRQKAFENCLKGS